MASIACAQRRQYRDRRSGKQVLELGPRTLIMGVLNVTPDSFSDGGRFSTLHRRCGARGRSPRRAPTFSTSAANRPARDPRRISAEEELRRVIPVLDALAGDYPAPDLHRHLEIGGRPGRPRTGRSDRQRCQRSRPTTPLSAPDAAQFGAGLILMHMRGEPQHADHPSAARTFWRNWSLGRGSRCAGAKTVVYPRIRSFLIRASASARSVAQNLEILRNLDRLAATGFPLLMGTSRKSFIGAILKNPEAERIWGTGATVAASIMFGAHIVRVHDVAADAGRRARSGCAGRRDDRRVNAVLVE